MAGFQRRIKVGGLIMATIVKRNQSYAVVYYYKDENGEEKQKWETVKTYKEAQKRKAEIEVQQNTFSFIAPSSQTLSEFLDDFVMLYGEKKWGISMYESQTALIENYIRPIIGNVPVQEISPLVVDKYLNTLKKTPAVSTKMRKARTKYVTPKTIEKIYKLLRTAFKQAVKWNLIAKNPFDSAILEKTTYAKRDIWTADTIRQALDGCQKGRLYIAINLSFACSLRLGEITGLRWQNVFIDDESISQDDAHLWIDAEIERAKLSTIDRLDKKDIYIVFPQVMPGSESRLVLKKPKTETSIRKVWLPKTVAYILREWKANQDELKEYLGDEYFDYDLVVCLSNGRPCDGRILEKDFEKLKTEIGLPDVVFHSLRHSSTTYKLKLNHGDIKATQGDTGHAEADMITKVYSHILDEDRKLNAKSFEESFYQKANPDLRKVEVPKTDAPPDISIADLIGQLQSNPELLRQLASLLSSSQ